MTDSQERPMADVVREREIYKKVRLADDHDIVEWIIELEDEVKSLSHDVESYVVAASDLANENDELIKRVKDLEEELEGALGCRDWATYGDYGDGYEDGFEAASDNDS